MTISPDREEIIAIVDGELTSEHALEVEARVMKSARLLEEVKGLRRLQVCIREQAEYHRAPAALRMALLEAHAPRAAPQVGLSLARWLIAPAGSVGMLRRWFSWRPMASASALAGLLVFSLNLTQSTISNTDQLQEDVVSSHVRAMLSHRLIDVASSDPHAGAIPIRAAGFLAASSGVDDR